MASRHLSLLALAALSVPDAGAAQGAPSSAQRDRLWLSIVAHAHVIGRDYFDFDGTTPVFFLEPRAAYTCDGRSRSIPRHIIDVAKQRGFIRGTRTAGLAQRVRQSETPVVVELGGVCAQRGDTFAVSLEVAVQWPGTEEGPMRGDGVLASYRFVWQQQRWRYVDMPLFSTPSLRPVRPSRRRGRRTSPK